MWFLFLVTVFAHAEGVLPPGKVAVVEPIRGLIVTCNKKYLPKVSELATFQPPSEQVSGVLIGAISEARELVKPEDYHGGGFIEADGKHACASVSKPRYLATVWNPAKTKIWCAVYDGYFLGPEECVVEERQDK
ncbi:MAG: hypothetical protein AB7K68_10140 [Bacteriovoracia bacterium]